VSAAQRLLVIDDDPGTCETLRDILTARGHLVETAVHGREGLRRLAAGPADVAIVDIGLPDIPGLELLDAIKSSSPDTEVIFITGHATVASAVRAINGAAFAYLVKPFEVDQLLATLGKAAEKRRLARALRESEERYRLLVESITDAVLFTDVEGRLVLVNSQASALTGYPREELSGRSVVSLLAPESVAEAEERLAEAAVGEPVVRAFQAELLRRDGRRSWTEVTISRVRRDDRVVGCLFVVHDVTDRRQLEEQLRHAQKMEAVGQLAGGIAHDFNNLLTVISGRAMFLHERLGPVHAWRRDVEQIMATADRAVELTRRLLAFSRRQVLQPRVMDPNASLAGLEPLLRQLIGEHITLIVRPGPALGRVRADPGQIEQVIMNLAVNARDAMPRGGRLVIETADAELDVGYARRHGEVSPGPYVLMAVSDTGVGMDAATRARIFEPFFTTKPLGEGTGLGLAMVYGIVKQSGGHVAVYSEVGRGSTFKIYLPRVADDGEPLPARPPVVWPAGGGETILLVEDEAGVRELAREVLEEAGYPVVEASDPEQALRIAEQHDGPIHLLLTDVVMPRIDGPELARRLLAARPRLKVLFMSGYTDGAVAEQRLLERGTAFLQKPFTPDALARKVRQVLDALPAGDVG
jgi:two-component system cell cycle sensor histidine kinase/response regulator CckA